MIIKKYSNRRLYDTDGSRYITLEELADKIRAGADVRVIDAKTNEDLTQSTLAQIILESRGAARLLPTALLVQLIRMGDEALAEFLGRYMSGALELYLQARQGAQTLAPLNPLANLPFSAANALARLLVGGMPTNFGWGEAPAPPPQYPPPQYPPYSASPHPQRPPPTPAPQQPSGSDMDDLRRELAELKRAVKGASAAPAKGGAKRRKAT